MWNDGIKEAIKQNIKAFREYIDKKLDDITPNYNRNRNNKKSGEEEDHLLLFDIFVSQIENDIYSRHEFAYKTIGNAKGM